MKCRRSGKYHLVEMQLPTHLQCLDNVTGETERKALSSMEALFPGLEEFEQDFTLNYRVPSADRHGANLRAENALRDTWPRRVSAVQTCNVHKAANALKRSLKISESTVSGVLHVGLARRSCGSLSLLRSALRDVFAANLAIVYGKPAEQHLRNVDQLLATYCPVRHLHGRPSLKNARRQFVLRRMLTSDVSSPEIVHVCGHGCCSSAEQTHHRFATMVTAALLPHTPPVFSRKNWTNSDRSFNWVGLLASTWNLLDLVLDRLRGKPQAGPAAGSNTQAPGSEDACLEDEEEWKRLLAAGTGAVEAKPTGHAAEMLPALEEDVDDTSRMTPAERQEAAVRGAGDFAASASVRQSVLMTRLGMNPGLQLINSQLRVSGSEWEMEQRVQQCKGQQRTFQILEAPKLVRNCFHEITSLLLQEPEKSLPVPSYCARWRSLLFRLLSGFACELEFQLRRFQRLFPCALFTLLEDPGNAASVCSLPQCCRDPLAKAHFNKWASPEELISEESLATLTALACVIHTDIADLESKHAAVREWTMMRGRGHTPSLSEVSARLTCHACHQMYASPGEQASAQQQRSRKRKRTPSPRQKYTRTRAGAWRAFLRVRGRGAPLNARRLKDLSAEYKRLSHDEYQEYKDMGIAAAVAGDIQQAMLRAGLVQQQQQLQPSGALVPSADFPQTLQIVRDDSVTLDQLPDFAAALHRSAVAERAERKHKEAEAASLLALPQPDQAMQQSLQRLGATAYMDHIRAGPEAAKFCRHQWQPPVLQFAKEGRVVPGFFFKFNFWCCCCYLYLAVPFFVSFSTCYVSLSPSLFLFWGPLSRAFHCLSLSLSLSLSFSLPLSPALSLSLCLSFSFSLPLPLPPPLPLPLPVPLPSSLSLSLSLSLFLSASLPGQERHLLAFGSARGQVGDNAQNDPARRAAN